MARYGRRLTQIFLSSTLAIALLASSSCTMSPRESSAVDSGYRADIRRTAGGIPHITATTLGDLGFGTSYAMAEDNVCIMARQFLVFGARQAQSLGVGEGRVESDFFYQLLIDRGVGGEKISAELDSLYRGATAGYNHYLNEVGVENLADKRCAGANWVVPVTDRDVRRVSRIDLFLDHMKALIVAAQPPASTADTEASVLSPLQISTAVDVFMEKPKQGGSNGVAVGKRWSASGRGLLLANPHMPWHEEFQRFYPMHQTVPGVFDIVGATIVGRPRVGFGTTRHVAWTSTVSTAKRSTFYRLELVPGDPTRYRFDGKEFAMQRENVSVPVRLADGSVESRSHTFYSTHFGAMLVQSDFFAWTDEHAFAVQMIDVGWRGEESAFEQFNAKSVHELKAVHDRHQFLTVNLIAADSNGDVLYADAGPVPNITDTQMQECAVLHGAAFDGTRSSCLWRDDSAAATPGILPPHELPVLVRDDYVLNSNDSYWLTHAEERLEGYASVLGKEKTPRTLRTRSAFDMISSLGLSGEGKKRAVTIPDLQSMLFSNSHQAGLILRNDLVSMCRDQPKVTLEGGQVVDLRHACTVLSEWDVHANLESRGAHLFREFLSIANEGKYHRWLPPSFKPRVAFDLNHPLRTPNGLDPRDNDDVLVSLAKAVQRLQGAGIALDARLGDVQYVTRNAQRIPIHGGQEIEGVYNKVEADFVGAAGYPEVTRWSSSWIMASDFSRDGPVIEAILAYSLSANPDSPHYADQTAMFSQKRWLALPFDTKDIDSATLRRYTVAQ